MTSGAPATPYTVAQYSAVECSAGRPAPNSRNTASAHKALITIHNLRSISILPPRF